MSPSQSLSTAHRRCSHTYTHPLLDDATHRTTERTRQLARRVRPRPLRAVGHHRHAQRGRGGGAADGGVQGRTIGGGGVAANAT